MFVLMRDVVFMLYGYATLAFVALALVGLAALTATSVARSCLAFTRRRCSLGWGQSGARLFMEHAISSRPLRSRICQRALLAPH